MHKIDINPTCTHARVSTHRLQICLTFFYLAVHTPGWLLQQPLGLVSPSPWSALILMPGRPRRHRRLAAACALPPARLLSAARSFFALRRGRRASSRCLHHWRPRPALTQPTLSLPAIRTLSGSLTPPAPINDSGANHSHCLLPYKPAPGTSLSPYPPSTTCIYLARRNPANPARRVLVHRARNPACNTACHGHATRAPRLLAHSHLPITPCPRLFIGRRSAPLRASRSPNLSCAACSGRHRRRSVLAPQRHQVRSKARLTWPWACVPSRLSATPCRRRSPARLLSSDHPHPARPPAPPPPAWAISSPLPSVPPLPTILCRARMATMAAAASFRRRPPSPFPCPRTPSCQLVG